MGIGGTLDSGKLRAPRWTDLIGSATAAKLGANQKPDFDYTNIGLLFPQNDTGEYICAVLQMDHRKKLGTGIRLHVHYIQASANKPVFSASVRFYGNGSEVPSFSVIKTSDAGGSQGVFAYAGSPILQIAKFPEIAAPVNESLSANLDMKFYREDNVVTGDVLVKYIDIHYQLDDGGSREEYVK